MMDTFETLNVTSSLHIMAKNAINPGTQFLFLIWRG
jgi:hypothetical protein